MISDMTKAARPRGSTCLAALAIASLCGCGDGAQHGSTAGAPGSAGPARGSIALTSEAFSPGGRIPSRFTCDGADVSPPLAWMPPEGAATLAIVMRDIDVPGRTFVHWMVTGLRARTRGLRAGQVPATARQLPSSLGTSRYRGPCPPPGDPPHRYVFTLYALTAQPSIPAGTPGPQAQQAIMRAAGAQGSLTGTYGR